VVTPPPKQAGRAAEKQVVCNGGDITPANVLQLFPASAGVVVSAKAIVNASVCFSISQLISRSAPG